METTKHFNKRELIQLLVADMRNRKLLLGLEKAGLSSEDFYTNLSSIILGKIGFDIQKDDTIFIWYEETMQALLEQDLSYFRERQHHQARRLYQMLMEKKYQAYPVNGSPRKAAAKRFLDWFMRK